MTTLGESVAKTKRPPAATPKAKAKSDRERMLDRGLVLATTIRVDRGDVVLDQRAITDERGRVTGQSLGDRRSYLTRYRKRGEIDERQCRAGDRFASDYEHAQGGVPSALDPAMLERSGGGGGSRSLAALSADPLAGLMVRQAVLAIGQPLASVVIWVGVEGRPCGEWAESLGKPARDGIACLRHALDALAQHYNRGKRD